MSAPLHAAGRVRIVYFDHARASDFQPGFQAGAAGIVRPSEDGGFDAVESLQLSANSRHALIEHGVARALSRLQVQFGPLGSGRQAMLLPACLDDAAAMLYEADRTTYGAVHEFGVRADHAGEAVEYRLVVDNREYQRSLARLQFLVTRASRSGFAVWLRI